MRPQHSNRAPADPDKVNVHSSWEELYWGDRLRCTAEQLRAAVDAVGPALADVRAQLENTRRSKPSALSDLAARTPKPTQQSTSAFQ